MACDEATGCPGHRGSWEAGAGDGAGVVGGIGLLDSALATPGARPQGRIKHHSRTRHLSTGDGAVVRGRASAQRTFSREGWARDRVDHTRSIVGGRPRGTDTPNSGGSGPPIGQACRSLGTADPQPSTRDRSRPALGSCGTAGRSPRGRGGRQSVGVARRKPARQGQSAVGRGGPEEARAARVEQQVCGVARRKPSLPGRGSRWSGAAAAANNRRARHRWSQPPLEGHAPMNRPIWERPTRGISSRAPLARERL